MTKAKVFMKIQYNKWTELLNTKLVEHNQSIRVIDYSCNTLTLSNGEVLQGDKFKKFKKRVMNKQTDLWVSNIDKLINGFITEAEIKSELASIGGKSVQKKYGNIIKQNLNTGTPWNAGTKGQNIGKLGPRSQTVKHKIGLKNSGQNNGMFGVKMSDKDKKYRSVLMKQKILHGKFTPNSNNRNTHWESTLDGKSYRSSWEALYQYFNQTAEYEKLRIGYIFNSVDSVYIVDFIDHVNRLVIEVKPSELCIGEKFDAKMLALTNWATANLYSVLIVTKKWLQEQTRDIDYSRFDKKTEMKIRKLYETDKTNRN